LKLLGDSATQSITLIDDILYLSKLENTSSIYSDKIEILAYISEACQSLAYIQESKNLNKYLFRFSVYIYISRT
jgi:signal transduction histidine kinase